MGAPDPQMMMAALSLFTNMMSANNQQQGEWGSTYSDKARSTLDEALDSVRSMRGNADITKNPSYQQGNEWLMSMFNDPEFFKSFEAPLQRQFQEQTVPDLANRFAGMGTGGSTGSTAFRNQLAREGSNLHTNIAALRGGMQQQAIPQMLNYAQQPVSNYQSLLNSATTPTNNVYQPPGAGYWGNIASQVTPAAIQAYVNSSGMNSGAHPSTQGGYQAQYPMTNQYANQFLTGEFT